MPEPLAVKPNGTSFDLFIPGPAFLIPEEDRDIPIVFTLNVLFHKGSVVLVHNRTRLKWEFPGGGIEAGETPHECAIREIFEESTQVLQALEPLGLAKFHLMPDDRFEYCAIFTAQLEDVLPFEPNNEMDALTMWQPFEHLETTDTITHALTKIAIDYYAEKDS